MTFKTGKIEMSPEEFWSIPRIVGWKYEYFGGAAYIEPRSVGALVHPQRIETGQKLPGSFAKGSSCRALVVDVRLLSREKLNLIREQILRSRVQHPCGGLIV